MWQEARPLALPPDKVASPLARKPYHLRATCITNWLRAGLPVAEVARRAGNLPEVIHRRYAGVIDDSETENNKRIEKTMASVSSVAVLREYVKHKFDFWRPPCDDHWSDLRYDFARARAICAKYSLDYGQGPYIAFFNKRPDFPEVWRDSEDPGSMNVHALEPLVPPEAVIRLGGLDAKRAAQLLDALERHLLAEGASPLHVGWKQFWLHVEQWMCDNGDAIRGVVVDLLRGVSFGA